MDTTMQQTPPQNISNITPFDAWLESLNKTRPTGWRWRKKGLIKTINIFGKLYISRDEIALFEERALAGHFAKESVTPSTRAVLQKHEPKA